MAIVTSIGTNYIAGALQGQFKLTDTYMVALYDSNANLGPSTPSYTTVHEVTGGNYTAGGIIMPGVAIVVDGTTIILTFSNATFPNISITDIRGCMIYDVTQNNTNVACFNFGNQVSTFNDNLTLIVPPANATLGLIKFN